MTATARPLYLIASDLDVLADLLYESGGELTPEIELRLAQLEGEFEQKAEGIGLLVKNVTAMASMVKAERQALAERETKLTGTAARLKDYLKTHMEQIGRPKIETPKIKLAIQNNGGNPAVKYEGEVLALPDRFIKTVTTHSVNVEEVLAAHKSGEVLPAGLTVERGTHLRVS